MPAHCALAVEASGSRLGCRGFRPKILKKAAGAQLIHRRGNRIPLWAVFQPLQVVLSFACSVASLSRSPSHYLPCHLQLPGGATADYLFGKGNPSTWCAGLTTVHCTPRSHTPIQGTEKHDLPQMEYVRSHQDRTAIPKLQQRKFTRTKPYVY